MSLEFDVIVAGAGLVGAAVGYGLAGLNKRVLMLDGGDTDFRAAKANFGLVWAHGKGLGEPAYQRLTVQACEAWPAFAAQLEAETGMELAYERKGGLHLCMSVDELTARARLLVALQAQAPELHPATPVLERDELLRRFPSMRLGPDVAGATFGELDGQVNPMRLLAALQAAYLRRGGVLRNNHAVTAIRMLPGGGFEVVAGDSIARAERVVIAAGLGSSPLARMVGLEVPIHPLRGQILVTERLAPLLPVPASGLRQTRDGTVMIGVTQEDVGYDLSTTTEAAVRMTRKALRILPDLAKAKLVRQWSCLRVMTPDGHPVYASSESCPGADIATCHSGVTLASFHADAYPKALLKGIRSASLESFHHERFNVSPNQ